MQDVEDIAYIIANGLSDPQIRMRLKETIDNSDYVENILEASEFLNKKLDIDDPTITLFSEMCKFSPKSIKEDFKDKIKNLDFGVFDIYFPYPDHRTKWLGDDQIIVAVVNSCIARGEDPVLAFNAKGEEVYFNPKLKLKVPTLIVCPSEKSGKYKIDDNTDMRAPQEEEYHYKTILHGLYVRDQYDGGLCGSEMEVYVKYKYYPTLGGNFGWYSTSIWDMLWVDGQGAVLANMNYQLINYTSEYYFEIEIWEDDDWFCGADDKIADMTYNTLHKWIDYSYWSLIGTNVSSVTYDAMEYYRLTDGTGGPTEGASAIDLKFDVLWY